MLVEDEPDDETLSNDEFSVVTRIDAQRNIDDSSCLLRRSIEDVADTATAQQSLQCEIDYAKTLGSEFILKPSLEPLLSGNLQLRYELGQGKILHTLVEELSKQNLRLCLPAVLAILRDLLESARIVQGHRPRETENSGSWGHGCLDLKKFLLDDSGRVVLFDVRFPATGLSEKLRSETLPFRAPEFVLSMTEGTGEMDVYSVAAMCVGLLFPEKVFVNGRSVDCGELVKGSGSEKLEWPDEELKAVLFKGLSTKPHVRFENAKAMFTALDALFTRHAAAMQKSRAEFSFLKEEIGSGTAAVVPSTLYSLGEAEDVSKETEASEVPLLVTENLMLTEKGQEIADPAEKKMENVLELPREDISVKPTARLQPVDDELEDLPMVDAELISEPTSSRTFDGSDEEATDLIFEDKIEALFDLAEQAKSEAPESKKLKPLDYEDPVRREVRESLSAPVAVSDIVSNAVSDAVSEAVSSSDIQLPTLSSTEAVASESRKNKVRSVVGTPIVASSESRPRGAKEEDLQLDIPKRRTSARNPLLSAEARSRSDRKMNQDHVRARTRYNRFSALGLVLAAGLVLWVWQTANIPLTTEGESREASSKAQTSVKRAVLVSAPSNKKDIRVTNPKFVLPKGEEKTEGKDVTANTESAGQEEEASVSNFGEALGLWGGQAEEETDRETASDTVASTELAKEDGSESEENESVKTGEQSPELSAQKSGASPRTAGVGGAGNIPRYQWGMRYSDKKGPVGDLLVNVIPWGIVYVDGRRIGYPPVYIENLGEGSHLVRVERTGFKKMMRKVEIKAGEETSVHIHFQTGEK